MAAPKSSKLTRTFALPLAIAVASLVGLVSALVGDGAWNAVSWLALAAPVAAVAWAWRRRA
ncbi:hypothetical protein DJ018_11205 [Phenylobacterium deserti]|uniref:DUF4175 domain-containing protein n=1 Tax=Phenylobacterium deserti TaxID=1914756 RepID=A0A328AIS2_9CAUL|nr:hypothetical protein DJ018_11205 [Phenylobacterium deserti]